MYSTFFCFVLFCFVFSSCFNSGITRNKTLTTDFEAELGGIAEQEGWQVILGTEAMVWQGLEQDRYWTGMEAEDLPVEKVRGVISKRLASISKKARMVSSQKL